MIRAMLQDSRSGRDDWGISDQGEVNPGLGHQVGLKLQHLDNFVVVFLDNFWTIGHTELQTIANI